MSSAGRVAADCPLGVALIGAGRWGENLARVLCADHTLAPVRLWDADDGAAACLASRQPRCSVASSLEEILDDATIAAVIVATPASTHASYALQALSSGKHVFVEKPLATTVADADLLCATAYEAGSTLMVGHTFLYGEPLRWLARAVRAGDLGRLLGVRTVRTSLGPVRGDVGAIFNLAPHDVSIMMALRPEQIVAVSCRREHVLGRAAEDGANIRLTYEDGVVGTIWVSSFEPRVRRHVAVLGDRAVADFDDRRDPPIEVTEVDLESTLFAHPGSGEIATHRFDRRRTWSPSLELEEPLAVEMAHFVRAVRTGRPVATSGEHGRRVVEILEAAHRSAAMMGAELPLRCDGGVP